MGKRLLLLLVCSMINLRQRCVIFQDLSGCSTTEIIMCAGHRLSLHVQISTMTRRHRIKIMHPQEALSAICLLLLMITCARQSEGEVWGCGDRQRCRSETLKQHDCPLTFKFNACSTFMMGFHLANPWVPPKLLHVYSNLV